MSMLFGVIDFTATVNTILNNPELLTMLFFGAWALAFGTFIVTFTIQKIREIKRFFGWETSREYPYQLQPKFNPYTGERLE